MAANENVKISFNFDSSGKLLTQIKEGAVCDLFISAAPKQMNALDGTLKDDADKNPDGLDMLVEGSRIDLLENKVALAVAEGNDKGIDSFDKLADLLKNGDVMLAIGNSDVPVGQYTQKIFAYYGIDETAIADKLSYGSNVKEVTTAVSEGTVDCGIIYASDAIADVDVVTRKDYQDGTATDCATGRVTAMELKGSNVLRYELADGTTILVRPSGTEPKIKVYILTQGADAAQRDENLAKYSAWVKTLTE